MVSRIVGFRGLLDLLIFGFHWCLPENCDFLENFTSREIWLPGKCDFPGKVTFWEVWFPGKCYFPGNNTSRELWLPGKCDFLGNVISREMWLPSKCVFLSNLTSWEMMWILRKCDFPGTRSLWRKWGCMVNCSTQITIETRLITKMKGNCQWSSETLLPQVYKDISF